MPFDALRPAVDGVAVDMFAVGAGADPMAADIAKLADLRDVESCQQAID